MYTFFRKQSHLFLLMALLSGIFSAPTHLYSKTVGGEFYGNNGTGQLNMIGTKWREIVLDENIIVYPENFEEMAQRIAAYFERIHEVSFDELGHEKYRGDKDNRRKITQLYQNFGSDAFGLVSMNPLHAFYSYSPFLFGSYRTHQALVVHEGRHVGQISGYKEYTHVDYNIFLGGQIDPILLLLPLWVTEGDAVLAETLFSDAGRGRDPAFFNHFRNLVLQKPEITDDYMKVVMYSDGVDFSIQNWYVYGFLLTSYLYENYDPNITIKITEELNDGFLLFPNPWMIIEKYTKKPLKVIWKDMIKDVRKKWTAQQQQIKSSMTEGNVVIGDKEKKGNLINYQVLATKKNGGAYITKQAFRDYQVDLYEVDSLTKKSSLKKIGTLNNKVSGSWDGSFSEKKSSIGGNYLAQINVVSSLDGKPGKSDGVNLRVTDLKTKSSFDIIAKDGNFNDVAISENGEKLAVTRYNKSYYFFVDVYDLKSKKLIKTIELGLEQEAFHPSWVGNNEIVFLVNSGESRGTVVTKLNVNSGKKEVITESPKEDWYYFPRIKDNKLFFISPYSGRNNIYAMDLSSKKRVQVTSRLNSVGTYDFVGDSIVFSDYNDKLSGFDIVTMPYNPSSWKPMGQVTKVPVIMYPKFLERNKEGISIKGGYDFSKKFASKEVSLLFPPRVFHHFNFLTIENTPTLKNQSAMEFGMDWTISDLPDTTQFTLSGSYGLLQTYTAKASLVNNLFYPTIRLNTVYKGGPEDVIEAQVRYQGQMIFNFNFSDSFMMNKHSISGGVSGQVIDIANQKKSQFNPTITYANSFSEYEVVNFANTVTYGVPFKNLSYVYGESKLDFNLNRWIYAANLKFIAKAEYQLGTEIHSSSSFLASSFLVQKTDIHAYFLDQEKFFLENELIALGGASYGMRLLDINTDLLLVYLKDLNFEVAGKSLLLGSGDPQIRVGGTVYFRLAYYPINRLAIKVGYSIFQDLTTSKPISSIYLGL